MTLLSSETTCESSELIHRKWAKMPASSPIDESFSSSLFSFMHSDYMPGLDPMVDSVMSYVRDASKTPYSSNVLSLDGDNAYDALAAALASPNGKAKFIVMFSDMQEHQRQLLIRFVYAATAIPEDSEFVLVPSASSQAVECVSRYLSSYSSDGSHPRLVFDESGGLDDYALLSHDSIVFLDAPFGDDEDYLYYVGNMDSIAEEFETLCRQKLLEECESRLLLSMMGLQQDESVRGYDSMLVPGLVTAFSNGHLSIPKFAQDHYSGKCKHFASKSSSPVRTGDFAFSFAKQEEELDAFVKETSSFLVSMDAVSRIWAYALEHCHVKLESMSEYFKALGKSLGDLDANAIGRLLDFGWVLSLSDYTGASVLLDGYFEGIPLCDLLA